MSLYGMRRVAREHLAKAKLTPKQRVLKKWPQARLIEVSGCTVAVFKTGCIDSTQLLSLAHSARGAWAEAERRMNSDMRRRRKP